MNPTRFGFLTLAAIVIGSCGGYQLSKWADRSVPTGVEVVSITEVIDGDTFDIHTGERVRAFGYDTPESYRPACEDEAELAHTATITAQRLIDHAAVVTIDRVGRLDRYHRTLARIYVDGHDLGDILIQAGLARPYEGGLRQGWCG